VLEGGHCHDHDWPVSGVGCGHGEALESFPGAHAVSEQGAAIAADGECDCFFLLGPKGRSDESGELGGGGVNVGGSQSQLDGRGVEGRASKVAGDLGVALEEGMGKGDKVGEDVRRFGVGGGDDSDDLVVRDEWENGGEYSVAGRWRLGSRHGNERLAKLEWELFVTVCARYEGEVLGWPGV
jgi:hypothetical protein